MKSRLIQWEFQLATEFSRTKFKVAISPYRFSDLERMDSVAKRR